MLSSEKYTMERNKIEQFYKIINGLCAKNNVTDCLMIKDIGTKMSQFVDDFVHNKIQIKDIYREFYKITKG
jgi:hypothetical protein